jgi:hypothetical protein
VPLQRLLQLPRVRLAGELVFQVHTQSAPVPTCPCSGCLDHTGDTVVRTMPPCSASTIREVTVVRPLPLCSASTIREVTVVRTLTHSQHRSF